MAWPVFGATQTLVRTPKSLRSGAAIAFAFAAVEIAVAGQERDAEPVYRPVP